VSEKRERPARRKNKSLSQLSSEALREYVNFHSPDEVTQAMNRICDQIDTAPDRFISAAARRALRRSQW